jgi:hypothetical protein
MRSRTRGLLAVAALALLVAAAGCADGGSTAPADAPAPDALQRNATAAMQDVRTATFTMAMDMEASGQSVSMDADGEMDVENRRMRMDLAMDTGGRTVEVTQYVIDETAYQRIQGDWQTQDLAGQEMWSGGNQLALQERMLENSSVEIIGSGTVDGHDVWIVAIEPGEDAIEQLLSGTASDVGENVDIQSLSFEQSVDVETSHVRKVDMRMDAEIQGQQATLNMTMTFENFNEPVDIQLPEEAPA